MIREYDVLDIARLTARHMALNTVVTISQPYLPGRLAILSLVAGETLSAKVSRLRGRSRRCVGIVACAAPQFVAARPLAGALRQVFHVAGHSEIRGRTSAYEHREIISEEPTGYK